MQNPFSGLWKITRSTRPARASFAAVSGDIRHLFRPFPESASSAFLTSGMIDRQTLAHDGEQHRLESRQLSSPGSRHRIKVLAEKTVSNGCTEAEASRRPAEMVGRLLERYALSLCSRRTGQWT